MAGLVPILVVFLAIAGFFLYSNFSSLAALRREVKRIEEQRDEKRGEAESAKLEARERLKEVERLREDLQDTRNKLKKRTEALNPGTKDKPSRTKGLPPTAPALGDSNGSVAAAVVRISNQELEDLHRAAEDQLRAQLADAETRLAEVTRREAEREAALEKAKRSLADARPVEPVVTEGRRPEEQVDALKTQVEALERASADREKQLRKELDRLTVDLKSAEKRASQNQQLYQVAKGQLVVVEDRLASIRKKYENAIPPDQLRRAAPPVEVPPPSEVVIAAETPSAPDAAEAPAAVVAEAHPAEPPPVASESQTPEATA